MASTCSRRAPCAKACAGCDARRAARSASSSRPTSCRRSSACATASSSSRTAAPSRPAASPSCSRETGERDFEEAFVKLAFVRRACRRRERRLRRATARLLGRPAQGALDALRDRRTLADRAGVFGAVGPLVLLAISASSPRSNRAPNSARSTRRARPCADAAQLPRAPDLPVRKRRPISRARLRKSTFSDPVVVVPLTRGGAGSRRRADRRDRLRQRQPALRGTRRGSSACWAATAASARCSAWRCAASR